MGPDQWIDTVLARATELRAAGVLELDVGGGLSVTFAPYSPPAAESKDDKREPQSPAPTSAWNDPASWRDGIVPGYDIRELDEHGDEVVP